MGIRAQEEEEEEKEEEEEAQTAPPREKQHLPETKRRVGKDGLRRTETRSACLILNLAAPSRASTLSPYYDYRRLCYCFQTYYALLPYNMCIVYCIEGS
jgi:hypothetical protein